jgi:hypothetical protein
MRRFQYPFTLGQFAKLIFWCALWFMILAPPLKRSWAALTEDLSWLAFLFIPLSILLRPPRSRIVRAPVSQDSCGPIVWRGFDDPDPPGAEVGGQGRCSHHNTSSR